MTVQSPAAQNSGLLYKTQTHTLTLLSHSLTPYRTEWRKSEPHMRKEMSLIAAHAAWHMGQWEEMAVYVDTVDSGPGGSNSPAHQATVHALALQQQQQQHPLLIGSNAANALGAAAAAAVSLGSSSSGRGVGGSSSSGFRLLGGTSSAAVAAGGGAGAGAAGGGGAASSTGAFLRAVLCIKHEQHALARLNVERSRGEGVCIVYNAIIYYIYYD